MFSTASELLKNWFSRRVGTCRLLRLWGAIGQSLLGNERCARARSSKGATLPPVLAAIAHLGGFENRTLWG